MIDSNMHVPWYDFVVLYLCLKVNSIFITSWINWLVFLLTGSPASMNKTKYLLVLRSLILRLSAPAFSESDVGETSTTTMKVFFFFFFVTEQLALDNSSIPLGLDPTQTQNKVIDQIILFAKQYIYNCKVFKRDIKVRSFLSILLNKYKVECILSHNAKDQINFMSNLEPYANLFRGLTS